MQNTFSKAKAAALVIIGFALVLAYYATPIIASVIERLPR